LYAWKTHQALSYWHSSCRNLVLITFYREELECRGIPVTVGAESRVSLAVACRVARAATKLGVRRERAAHSRLRRKPIRGAGML